MTQTVQVQIQKFPCPYCGLVDSVTSQGSAHGKRRFYCEKCHKYFVDPTKRERTLYTEQSENPPCPDCGSRFVVKNGHLNGVQKFRCRDCKRCFCEGGEPREIRAFKPRESRPVLKNIVIQPRPLPSIDSLVGIPCFGCDSLNQCNPETCPRLEEWLLSG